MKILLTIVTFLLFTCTHSYGQGTLVLQHKKKKHKIKPIDHDREYYIKTNDTSYYSTVVNFTKTSLSVTGRVKTNRDTVYTHHRKIDKTRDTIYLVTTPLYRMDTIIILFSDIHVLKKDWFKNKGWLLPFAEFLAGAALAVVFLPVAAIDKGKEGVKNWAQFEGVLMGISAPPLFVGTRSTKYDLQKKWTLKVMD